MVNQSLPSPEKRWLEEDCLFQLLEPSAYFQGRLLLVLRGGYCFFHGFSIISIS